MAVGDDAAAAGMPLVPNTGEEGKVRYGAREINRTRDFIAQTKNTILTSTVWPISKGGTGQTNAVAALAALGGAPSVHSHTGAQVDIDQSYVVNTSDGGSWASLNLTLRQLDLFIDNLSSGKTDVPPDGGRAVSDCNGGHTMGLYWNGSGPVVRIDGSTDIILAANSTVSAINGAVTTMAGGSVVGKANAWTSIEIVRYAHGPDGSAYNRQAGNNRFAVWMDDGLEFGRATSARKYKEDIHPAEINPADVLALVPVSYHRKTDPEGVREFGLIADDVNETLPQIVTWFPNEDGVKEIDGVQYDLLPVALLSVVKDQQKRIEALEKALEGLGVLNE